jgi:myo-inositol-1(or 4)-monophosphatase
VHELPRLVREAERIAREAGGILLRHFEQLTAVESKGHGDPVTAADRESEEYVREACVAVTPGVPVYGEEYGRYGADGSLSDACWVVDPLDGTVNYAASMPLYAVSIAFLQAGRPTVGVIYDPTRDQAFTAVEGAGSYRDGVRMTVSERDPFDPVAPIAISADIIRRRPKFLTRLPKGRSLGSAALQMSYVAAGIFDAAMDPLTRLWDVAAGSLLVTEAGGVVTRWDGSSIFPVAPDDPGFAGAPVEYLVSNGLRHADLVDMTTGWPDC